MDERRFYRTPLDRNSQLLLLGFIPVMSLVKIIVFLCSDAYIHTHFPAQYGTMCGTTVPPCKHIPEIIYRLNPTHSHAHTDTWTGFSQAASETVKISLPYLAQRTQLSINSVCISPLQVILSLLFCRRSPRVGSHACQKLPAVCLLDKCTRWSIRDSS